MIFRRKKKNDNSNNNRDWKEKNQKYLNQLQKFFDAVDKVENIEIRKGIINEVLRCDMLLTELAQKEINRYKKIIKKHYN